ncbi:hypothetical protein F4775DRAFT_607574 [Biscogniauxia sp. FL1348]|nr:hypothetical protein F4775DRAFT_607574 [Biscogniauxia sp. FL1348]
MQFNTILLVTTTAFGLTNAACTLIGWDNWDCIGGKGAARKVPTDGICIEMCEMCGCAGYSLSDDCNLVPIEKHTGSGYTGSTPSINDLGAGCHGAGGSTISLGSPALNFQLRAVEYYDCLKEATVEIISNS